MGWIKIKRRKRKQPFQLLRRKYYFICWGNGGRSTFIWPRQQAIERARRMDRLYEEGQAMLRDGHKRRVAAKYHHLELFQGSREELQRRKWPGGYRYENKADTDSIGDQCSVEDVCYWLALASKDSP